MKTKKLVITAMFLAIAVILSFIKIFELPFGGSVTLASAMPIIIIGYIYGIKWGINSALVYAVLQIFTGMNTISAFFLPGENQMAFSAAVGICIFDYVLAYGAIGCGGIFKNKFKSRLKEIVMGTIFAMTLKYLIHIISGTIFFGMWADWFFGDGTGLSQIKALKPFCDFVVNNMKGTGLSLFYSVIYNGAYMIPEIAVTSIAVPFVYKITKLNENAEFV